MISRDYRVKYCVKNSLDKTECFFLWAMGLENICEISLTLKSLTQRIDNQSPGACYSDVRLPRQAQQHLPVDQPWKYIPI